MKRSTIILAMYISLLVFCLPLLSEKQLEQDIPDFSNKERSEVPEAYTWRLEDIYETANHWEKERAEVVQMIKGIADMARGWAESPGRMLALLDRINEIELRIHRLYYYAVLRSIPDMGNSRYQQMKGQIEGLKVQMKEKTAFVEQDVLRLGAEAFSGYLEAGAGLDRFRFRVEKILRMRDHVLPADQQRIVSLAGLVCGGAEQAFNYMCRVEMPPVKVTLSDSRTVNVGIENIRKMRAVPNPADRTLVAKTYWQNCEQFGRTMAVLLDTAMREHLFFARAHHYKDCLEASLYKENIDPQVYHNLVGQVRGNLAPLHRYLALKKEFLGLEKMRFEDVYANKMEDMGKRYTYSQAKAMILNMMKPLGKAYIEVLKKAFAGRWIDVYLHKGKINAGGSGGIYGAHPYVTVVFDGNYESLAMLSHELGHAVHYYFSEQNQEFCNSGSSHFLAETVATFNEYILIRYLLENEESDLFRLYLLESYLDIFTLSLYRLTLYAELELAMHRRVEEGDALTVDWLNRKCLELHRFYFGHDRGILEVGDYIRSQWEGMPILFQNFYVFTYSTGDIASIAMMDTVYNGTEKDRERYLGILKAGGSVYPLDLLKAVGVDLTTPEPFLAVFKRFDDLIGRMEQTMRRLKKQGKL